MTELGTRSTYRKSGCRTLSAYGCARLSPTRPHAACDVAGAGNGDMVRTEVPALGESRRQQLLPLPTSTAPALDPTTLYNEAHRLRAEPFVAFARSRSDGACEVVLVAQRAQWTHADRAVTVARWIIDFSFSILIG